MELDKKIIGNRIKYLRENEKLTQKDLAIKLGLKGETAIANYEAGYSIPKDEIKFKMCELFNCSIDYLLGKSDIRNTEDALKEEFYNNYSEEIKGLTTEEIITALRFYKEMKNKYSK